MQDEKDVAKKNESPKSNGRVEKKSIGDKFRDIKGEFDKIIWPSRQELTKQTITVVFISLLFGGVIFAMDSVYGLGLGLLMQLFGRG